MCVCVWEPQQEACKKCTGRWDGEAFASRRGAKGRSEQWELVPRSTSFLGPRIGSQNLEPPVSSPKSAGLFL